jgi:hypothetical protein
MIKNIQENRKDLLGSLKGRTTSETLNLVILVILLGVVSALVLDYSITLENRGKLGNNFEAIFHTNKNVYNIGESIESEVTLINLENTEIILEKIEYYTSIYDMNNDSKKIFFTEEKYDLDNRITLKPHNTYSLALGKIWEQQDMENQQVSEGRYLIEVQLPNYNFTISKIIYIKK